MRVIYIGKTDDRTNSLFLNYGMTGELKMISYNHGIFTPDGSSIGTIVSKQEIYSPNNEY